MVKMTVETTRMSYLKTARNVKTLEISNAKMVGVFRNDGSVISKTIVAITQTNSRLIAKTTTEVVRKANSNVKTTNVYPVDGAVIMIMTVEINQMKKIVQILRAE